MVPVKAETIFIGSAMEDRVRRRASHIVTSLNCSRWTLPWTFSREWAGKSWNAPSKGTYCRKRN